MIVREKIIGIREKLPGRIYTEATQAVFNEKTKRGYGSLKGKIQMADDFDAPLEDFKEYML